MRATIALTGHKYDGYPVMITHLGMNRHPFLDSAYGHRRSYPNQRWAAVIILGRGQASELMDTISMEALLITEGEA